MTKGNGSVHLTGFYEPDQEEPLPIDEEDDDDEEGEEAELDDDEEE